MSASKDVKAALAAKQPAPDTDLTAAPVPPRQPLPAPMLSTDIQTTPVQQKKRKSDGKKRPPRGYTLDVELVKQFQHLAIDEERPLYEVMEEALREYLERRQGTA